MVVVIGVSWTEGVGPGACMCYGAAPDGAEGTPSLVRMEGGEGRGREVLGV